MLTLRLEQMQAEGDAYPVKVTLEGERAPRQSADASVKLDISAQDLEDLRWYLEDFLQRPHDPAPKIAAMTEQRLAAVGVQLFQDIFDRSENTKKIWFKLQDRLHEARVEIITDVQNASAIPWELLRDPMNNTPLALQAQAFVRAQPEAGRTPTLPDGGPGPIRILLAICRPGRESDVPFRSVASRLIKGLSASEQFQLDVLRPATFERLSDVLSAAHRAGKPYHIVHFDGHGDYIELDSLANAAAQKPELRQYMFSTVGLEPGTHGYLLFEKPGVELNIEFVRGEKLGDLMFRTGVPVLVLNACRSAHAEAPEKPEAAADDVHAQVRAFGSLAQEVMDKGVAGVVAMRYNVYVVTAAQFVADLYAALAGGQGLGEAVSSGRKQLKAQPLRSIAYQPRALQDWCVPIVYEAGQIQLFPKAAAAPTLKITFGAGDATPARGVISQDLPKEPDAGFYGRDETLLALDRAFDEHPIVLLHAYAGSGKTTSAAEFARWYSLTGGVDGPVLFTAFEQYRPLARVLDDFGRVFGAMLEQQANIHWLALDDDARHAVALQVMAQIPVLWLWDNVEPVAGFPSGTPSAWTDAEQKALADFLRDARATQAKFLLTSRRDERAWLSDLPARVAIPPMPMQERVQLARALAEKQRRRIDDVDDWRPLLHFTQGNPLTITVLVGQALRDRLRTRAQIEDFVQRLRAGEAAFTDEQSEGRSRSLGASLSFGFAENFSAAERSILALLHFFQGFVSEGVLRGMGALELVGEHALPEVRGLTREAGINLLDRAAEVGLLAAYGGGYYSIHPALPWYFGALFRQFYPDALPADGVGAGQAPPADPDLAPPSTALAAARAYVEALGALANYYTEQYVSGNRGVIGMLNAEEANLLHARRLARGHGWWGGVTSAMQGLRVLYEHTGRRGEWRRLVDEIAPDFSDPATEGPLPGREEDWSLVTEYRVRLARESRQWAAAERLQRALIAWRRQQAAPLLPPPAADSSLAARSPGSVPEGGVAGAGGEGLTEEQKNRIRSLAVSLGGLAGIQREQEKPETVQSSEESILLYHQIGDRTAEAIRAFNLGHAYKDIPALRDLAQAERWYRRSLELFAAGDRLGRGKVTNQLGFVAYERFKEARQSSQPEAELLRPLNDALKSYQQALELLPGDAVADLAVTHNQLGNIYDDASDLERALHHYRESIRYKEAAGNIYAAGTTRYNVALTLRDAGRFEQAREYARAALRNFETFGERAAAEIERTQRLLAKIEQAMAQGGG